MQTQQVRLGSGSEVSLKIFTILLKKRKRNEPDSKNWLEEEV
jgi:hypothetical protein